MIQQICKWCGVEPVEKHQTYCSKRCRQAAYRFRRLSRLEVAAREPKRLAYADPPYPGLAKKYYQYEDTYQGEVDHVRLLEQLATYDGWALSTSSKALRYILPMCPEDVHTCAWVKPIPPSPNARGLNVRWEPLIVKQARLSFGAVRDWISCQPARFGGELIGRKPIAFCSFLFEALAAAPDDIFDDLFPGTGIVSAAWREFSSSTPANDSAKDLDRKAVRTWKTTSDIYP